MIKNFIKIVLIYSTNDLKKSEDGKMIDWVTVSSSIATSTIVCSVLVWFCREWISARLKKSIQHEYDTKLEGYKAGYQKFLDENRITFSLWHESQAKAIKETYSEIAKLCVAIDLKIHCMTDRSSQFFRPRASAAAAARTRARKHSPPFVPSGDTASAD